MFQLTRKKILILVGDLVLTAVLVALDRVSKILAVNYLKEKPAIPIIRSVLELNYLENRGAAFGMLQGQKVFLIPCLIMCIIA